MTFIIILLLILLGIVLLLIEFAIIPGFTIAGIGGIVLLGYSIYLAFSVYGTIAGVATLLFIVIFIPILFYKFFKGRISKNMKLETKISGKAESFDKHKISAGDKGVSLTRLNPIGKVTINDEVCEGKSIGNFIDPGEEIEVVKVLNNQLIVKHINFNGHDD